MKRNQRGERTPILILIFLLFARIAAYMFIFSNFSRARKNSGNIWIFFKPGLATQFFLIEESIFRNI